MNGPICKIKCRKSMQLPILSSSTVTLDVTTLNPNNQTKYYDGRLE